MNIGSIGRASLVALLLFVTGQAVASCNAQQQCSDYQSAMAACGASKAYFEANNAGNSASCVVMNPGSAVPNSNAGWIQLQASAGFKDQGDWSFDGVAPPPTPTCTQKLPPSTAPDWPGAIDTGMTLCMHNAVSDDGGTALSCNVSFHASGPSYKGKYGGFLTPGTLAPTGDTCNWQPGQHWQKPTGSGDDTYATTAAKSVVPAIAADVLPVPLVQSAGRPCGGGSCYDPVTDSYIAVDGDGNQVSVPGSTASGSGGCISSASAVLCAGSPTPPAPTPATGVTDAAAQIASSDQFGRYQASTGPVNVTVNTYNTGSASKPPTSGEQAGDSGPAHAGSTAAPGDGTGSSGGQDCNSPPIVTGSGGLQAVALQTWRTRCALEGSNLGKGTAKTLGSDLYTPDTGTTGSAVADFQAKVKSAPIGQAVTGFFNVGGVGGSCPTWTLPANDWLPAQTFDFYCRDELSTLLDFAGWLMLFAAAWAAFTIGMGDS